MCCVCLIVVCLFGCCCLGEHNSSVIQSVLDREFKKERKLNSVESELVQQKKIMCNMDKEYDSTPVFVCKYVCVVWLY